jgi:Reverse transcriptase (RNA-dependent DNA polymerase)
MLYIYAKGSINKFETLDLFSSEGEQRKIIQSNPISQDQESHENTSLVSSPTCDLISETRLPPRINRDIPLKQYGYELENETSRESEYPIVKYTIIKNLPDPLKKFANEITTSIILERVEDAMKDPKWVETIKIEMNALEENCKWKLVELPKGKKPVGCKWVFTIKYNAKGKVERYKARLVAKGYTQTYGIDYQETFSHVAKLNMI